MAGLLQKEEAKLEVGGFITDLLFVVGLIVAIGALLVTGGAYAYTKILEKNTAELKDQVGKLEVELEPRLLDQILALDRKLGSMRSVLAAHTVSTNVFKLLEENTLLQVRFSIFTYLADQRRVELTGQAATYAVLAEQVRTFESLEEIEDVNFGGLSLSDKGLVSFKMSIIFSPAVSQFK